MATLIATLGTVIGGAGVGGSTLGTLLSLGGTALSAVSSIQAGNAQAAAANFQARQQEQAAKTERASSQREAIEDRRQGRLLMSRARAAGAASGGGIDFEGMGAIMSEAERRALTSLWGGEERAKGRETDAAATRFEGQQQRKASRIEGFGTLLTQGASWLDNYGTSWDRRRGATA